jgi:putative transposon-encoded protein
MLPDPGRAVKRRRQARRTFVNVVVPMLSKIPNNEEKPIQNPGSSSECDKHDKHDKVKLEVYGEEMVEKVVRLSGNSGRVYLPPDWVGCRVKIIRLD